jgi:hypothetical protein
MADMRFLWPLMALPAAAVLLLGLACNGSGEEEPTIGITLTSPTPTPLSTPAPSPTPSPTATPTPIAEVCGVNPDPARPSVLQVQEPQPGERVKNPFHVRGWGSSRVFHEIGMVVAVVDAYGELVQVMVDVPPQARAHRALPPGLQNTEFTHPFAVDIFLTDLAGPTPFCLWAFLETDGEGNPKKMVQVSVIVVP